MTFAEQLVRFIEPLKRRLSSMLCCALINAVKDNNNIQLVEVKINDDEVHKDIERIQEYGFTSVPPPNSESVVMFIGGNRSHGLVIATESSRYRLKDLPSGAVAIYNMNGDYVKLTKDKIEIVANEVTIAGTSGKKLLTEDILSVLNNHVHQSASPGSPTGPALYPYPTPSPFNVNLHATSKTKAD